MVAAPMVAAPMVAAPVVGAAHSASSICSCRNQQGSRRNRRNEREFA